MKPSSILSTCAFGLAVLSAPVASHAGTSFSEGFDTPGTVPFGWFLKNNSESTSAPGSPVGLSWNTRAQIGFDPTPVNPYQGAGFAVASFQSIGTGVGTISNWLISPTVFGLSNGDTFSFYTTTLPGSTFVDHLELRLSTAGTSIDVGTTSTSVGKFTTVLASVNPTFAGPGYPDSWTLVTATVSGLAAPTSGRVAFRYYVEGGGPLGFNSNIIGVDSFSYTAAAAVPEPATWALMLAGATGLIGLRQRQRGALTRT